MSEQSSYITEQVAKLHAHRLRLESRIVRQSIGSHGRVHKLETVVDERLEDRLAGVGVLGSQLVHQTGVRRVPVRRVRLRVRRVREHRV